MTKYAAFGTEIQLHDGGSPGTYATVAHVRSISGPSFTFDMIDVTAHDSPGSFEEVVASIIRQGELTFEIIYDPEEATHDNTTGLLSVLTSRAARQWKLIFSDANNSEFEFDAFCMGFAPQAPHDGALTANITLKLTGQPTFA